MQDLLLYEKEIWEEKMIPVGVDEVGRGCLAGPVVAGAVIIPQDNELLKYFSEVNDSKKLSEKKRKELFYIIEKYSIDYGIGIVSANVIDEINILKASFLAMRRALSCIDAKYDYVLVDGNKSIPNIQKSQKTIVKGDSKSLSIASASIIAKVIRDQIMIELEEKYKGYSLKKHKGYPTKEHFLALEKFGLTDIHRISFCKKIL